nr:hypothetical protein [Candidatus Undinarchaeales archaeon ERR594346 U_76725]
MQENPFSDSVPSHLAIAATVYTRALSDLEKLSDTNRSKLFLVIGDYGNGKSHALEKLKNDINIQKKDKLAVYTSAFATKSLRRIYEQVCAELITGKIEKFEKGVEARLAMVSKGIPSKIIEIFYEGNHLKNLDEISESLPFGKVVNSSADAVDFICAISLLVGQMILLIDDIEEASVLERAERKAFFGHIRALYDQSVRKDLNLSVILAMTYKKVELLEADRPDLLERTDHFIDFVKPSKKEFFEMVKRRLEVSGLGNYSFTDDALETTWESLPSIRSMFNLLRDSLDKAEKDGVEEIKSIVIPQKKKSEMASALQRSAYKPADDEIVTVLQKKDGLYVEEIVSRTEMSASWIRHRLADLVRGNVLRKEQEARNKPAKYYLVKGESR